MRADLYLPADRFSAFTDPDQSKMPLAGQLDPFGWDVKS
jgi:hypothetical protein